MTNGMIAGVLVLLIGLGYGGLEGLGLFASILLLLFVLATWNRY